MTNVLVYFLVLGLLVMDVRCNIRLQISKNNNDFVMPVFNMVQERIGNTFSLICDLISTEDNNLIDDNLVWMRGENYSSMTRVPSKCMINKSEKKFDPATVQDNGRYHCFSLKFNLNISITLSIVENGKWNEARPMRETTYCNDQMFHCRSNGHCIIPHYVCDGKPDCKDGSDETVEKCQGDPCKDKIPCDDGRCIPSSWCCDRHHDLNCSVTNRPKCCQSTVLSESYEELEYGYPNLTHSQHNGARYLFISVCIVSILFSIVLLLLIVSKVVIFAKKSALQQQHRNLCENIAMRNQTNVNIIRTNFATSNFYSFPTRNGCVRQIEIDESDVDDPLLFSNARYVTSLSDQPPSYIDVLHNNRVNNEPPPPYTSSEILN